MGVYLATIKYLRISEVILLLLLAFPLITSLGTLLIKHLATVPISVSGIYGDSMSFNNVLNIV